jgi:hydrogenase maturation protease
MDALTGFARAVIIDASAAGRGAPGTIHELDIDEAIPTVRATGYHDLSVRDALAFGRVLGLALPDTVTFLAVEAADTLTFGETPTPAVAAAVPELVRRVEERLRAWGVLEREAACTRPV